MLRTVKRWFSTDETKQLAKDLDQLQDRFLDFGHKIEGMQLRIDRHLNKLQMRDARDQRPRDALTQEERDILEELRERGAADRTQDPFYS